MSARAVVIALGLLLAGLVVSAEPAASKPLESTRFHDVFTEFFTCETTGTPVRHDGDLWVHSLVNLRGSSPFPYFQENVQGTDVFTNLDTGGTYTSEFSVVARDHSITDNGDGTITIVFLATGGNRWYDTNGDLVLNDPGQFRASFVVDYNGTPSDPTDDQEVEGSFQIVKGSTGRNDTEGRDFCEDLVLFT